MKTLPIHLDRLAQALAVQGVTLKRHQLLSVAAATFGYRNQNTLAAAAKAGDLDAPLAEVIGAFELQTGERLAIIRDPRAKAPFAIDLSFVEHSIEGGANLYAPSPYGHLVDLTPLADRPITNAPGQQTLAQSDTVITLEVHSATIDHKHGQNSYVTLTEHQLDQKIAEYCRENWSYTELKDAAPNGDTDAVELYFEAMDGEEYLNRPRPELLEIPPSDLARQLATYTTPRNSAPSTIALGLDLAHVPPNADPWEEDPNYPRSDWAEEVANDDTLRGYHDWLAAKRDQAAEDDEPSGGASNIADHPASTNTLLSRTEPDHQFLVLTNGMGDHAWGDAALMDRLRLDYSIIPGDGFYPLTQDEIIYIADCGLDLPNGMHLRLGYSCLYEGKKYLCPTIEIEPGDIAALKDRSNFLTAVIPLIRAIGGHVVTEERTGTTTCHEIWLLIPFSYAQQNAVDTSDWKIKLARLLLPAIRPRVVATFHPQAWVNDNAVSVDAEGPATWDVTAEIIAMGSDRALAIRDRDDTSDGLAHSLLAPKWVKEWSGPFHVSVAESIGEYQQAAATS